MFDDFSPARWSSIRWFRGFYAGPDLHGLLWEGNVGQESELLLFASFLVGENECIEMGLNRLFSYELLNLFEFEKCSAFLKYCECFVKRILKHSISFSFS